MADSRLERICKALVSKLTMTGSTSGKTYTGARPTRRQWVDGAWAANTCYISVASSVPESPYPAEGKCDWSATFTVSAIIDSNTTDPIDAIINLAAADVISALMADIKLGGLAYNLEVVAIDNFPDPTESVSGAEITIEIQYRTDAVNLTI